MPLGAPEVEGAFPVSEPVFDLAGGAGIDPDPEAGVGCGADVDVDPVGAVMDCGDEIDGFGTDGAFPTWAVDAVSPFIFADSGTPQMLLLKMEQGLWHRPLPVAADSLAGLPGLVACPVELPLSKHWALT